MTREDAYFHDTWLGMAQPDGLVVSTPVLVEAQCAITAGTTSPCPPSTPRATRPRSARCGCSRTRSSTVSFCSTTCPCWATPTICPVGRPPRGTGQLAIGLHARGGLRSGDPHDALHRLALWRPPAVGPPAAGSPGGSRRSGRLPALRMARGGSCLCSMSLPPWGGSRSSSRCWPSSVAMGSGRSGGERRSPEESFRPGRCLTYPTRSAWFGGLGRAPGFLERVSPGGAGIHCTSSRLKQPCATTSPRTITVSEPVTSRSSAPFSQKMPF